MKLKDALDLSIKKYKAGESDEAHNILDKVLSIKPDNFSALKLKGSIYFTDDEIENAQIYIDKALSINPNTPDLWLKRSQTHEGDNYAKQAIIDINKGLKASQNYAPLFAQKAEILFDIEKEREAISNITQAIKLEPKNIHYLDMRASFYESLMYDIDDTDSSDLITLCDGEEVIKPWLEKLLLDYLSICKLSQDWSYHNSLAMLLMNAGKTSDAIKVFDKILKMDINEDIREATERFRHACTQGKEGVKKLQNKLLDETASKLSEVLDEDHIIAAEIAADIANVAEEEPVKMEALESNSRLNKKALKFCDKTEKELNSLGFNSLGDYDPVSTPIDNVFMRLFIHSNNKITAACYRIDIPWPGFLGFLRLFLSGKWKHSQIVELETECDDGSFFITNNSGDTNPFSSAPNILRTQLKTNTSAEQLYIAHNKIVDTYLTAKPGVSAINQTNIDELVASQERARRANTDYRKSIGYVTDDELKALLGNHYDKLKGPVIEFLKGIT